VAPLETREKVDAACKKRTAFWIREKKSYADVELCDWLENFELKKGDLKINSGVYNMDDLRDYGKKHGYCPYFLSRHLIKTANLVVFNYLYVLDSVIDELNPEEIKKNSVVIFDEAHNIDDVCREAYTVEMNKKMMEMCNQNVEKLEKKIKETELYNKEKLEKEFDSMIQNLKSKQII
jgi:DNA excision repair protein ERCC-2